MADVNPTPAAAPAVTSDAEPVTTSDVKPSIHPALSFIYSFERALALGDKSPIDRHGNVYHRLLQAYRVTPESLLENMKKLDAISSSDTDLTPDESFYTRLAVVILREAAYATERESEPLEMTKASLLGEDKDRRLRLLVLAKLRNRDRDDKMSPEDKVTWNLATQDLLKKFHETPLIAGAPVPDVEKFLADQGVEQKRSRSQEISTLALLQTWNSAFGKTGSWEEVDFPMPADLPKVFLNELCTAAKTRAILTKLMQIEVAAVLFRHVIADATMLARIDRALPEPSRGKPAEDGWTQVKSTRRGRRPNA